MPNEEVDEAPEPSVSKSISKTRLAVISVEEFIECDRKPGYSALRTLPLKASCFDTGAAGSKISEIGPVERPLRERCSLGGAPFFTLARLRRFLARR